MVHHSLFMHQAPINCNESLETDKPADPVVIMAFSGQKVSATRISIPFWTYLDI